MSIRVIAGDCLEVMSGMEANSVDAIVTDPPAGISFMGKTWDHDKGGRDQWIAWMQTVAAECLRVLKPGGHALVWALPRTSHWTATAWENAGFTVRDRVIHIFGSGFPKSACVSKAIDKAAGADREVVGSKFGQPGYRTGPTGDNDVYGSGLANGEAKCTITAPATDAARQWEGWGTALKPAAEDFWLLRKPFPKGYTVAQNVLAHGTGAINVDGCRVGSGERPVMVRTSTIVAASSMSGASTGATANGETTSLGRWPANVIHDGSDEVLAAFPEGSVNKAGVFASGQPAGWPGGSNNIGRSGSATREVFGYGDTGSAARFFHNTREGESRVFYTAKASSFDRNDGMQGLPQRITDDGRNTPIDNPYLRGKTERGNHHPTVKPTELMRWLCRLITPPGGKILDPFCGSGSTLKAAEIEGFSAIGIEIDPDYVEIARRRIASDMPMFAEICKGYALTEEALSNSASETLWCSPYCVPEQVLQFDLFAEVAAMNTPTLRSREDTRPLADKRLRDACA